VIKFSQKVSYVGIRSEKQMGVRQNEFKFPPTPSKIPAPRAVPETTKGQYYTQYPTFGLI